MSIDDERLEEGQKVWKVDPAGMMLVSDELPEGVTNLGNFTSFKGGLN